MEQLLRAQLRTATLRAFGSPGAGCICEGQAYDTDAGPVFVKRSVRVCVCTIRDLPLASVRRLLGVVLTFLSSKRQGR
uniref:Uncharacterized protein n=1 Tax=Piliocolobus tephrosceles TaxID=591936 RepID=A0A8C9H4F2_9PRIM